MSLDCRDCAHYGEENKNDFYCEKYGKWYSCDEVEEIFDECPGFSK